MASSPSGSPSRRPPDPGPSRSNRPRAEPIRKKSDGRWTRRVRPPPSIDHRSVSAPAPTFSRPPLHRAGAGVVSWGKTLITRPIGARTAMETEKLLCYGAMAAAGLVAVLFLLDIVAQIFG